MVCAECGGNAIVGVGTPPRDLCLAHFEAWLAAQAKMIKDARRLLGSIW